MGFESTTHDRCIYKKVIDGNVVYLLRQVDNMCAAICDQKTAEKISDIIERKIISKDKEEKGIIPFKFFELIHEYDGVDIKKITHCIDMSCETYINRLTKSHNWDINIKLSSSGDNKKINMEASVASQVKISTFYPVNGDHLQTLPECLKSTSLYDHHKIVPIPSDSIGKIHQAVHPEESTTHYQVVESNFFF